jgi:hypothetical protein
VVVVPGDTQACGTVSGSGRGWCLVQGAAAQAVGCGQAIEFTPGEPPAGTAVALVCP